MAVRKRGKKWLIDIRQGRKGRLYHTFDGTKEQAYEMERALRMEVGKQRPTSIVTIEQIAEWYLEHVRLHQSVITFRDKKRMLFGSILPFFGKLTLEGVNSILIDKYKAKRIDEIHHGSAKAKGHRQINLELLCLSALSKWAVQNNFAAEQIRVKPLPYKAPLPEILSRKELNAFLKAMEPFYRAMFLLMYQLGMRKEEVFSLKSDQVDFQNGIILVKGKGDKQRIVPLNDTVKAALLDVCKGIDNGLVFPSKRTGEKYTDIRYQIRKAIEKVGIERRVYPHLLRHCFGAHSLERSGDIRTLQEVMGHSQIKVTERYTQVATVLKKKLIKAME
jgi:site-specific recombinase XerD